MTEFFKIMGIPITKKAANNKQMLSWADQKKWLDISDVTDRSEIFTGLQVYK